MTPEAAATILIHHQKWRKGADIAPTDPKNLSDALDVAIAALSDPAAAWRNEGFNEWRQSRASRATKD